jgi:hypothetical protein
LAPEKELNRRTPTSALVLTIYGEYPIFGIEARAVLARPEVSGAAAGGPWDLAKPR